MAMHENAVGREISHLVQGSHASWKYWKVLDFPPKISRRGRSWKMSLVMKSPGN